VALATPSCALSLHSIKVRPLTFLSAEMPQVQVRTALAWNTNTTRYSNADPTTSPKPAAFNGTLTISIADTNSSQPSQVRRHALQLHHVSGESRACSGMLPRALMQCTPATTSAGRQTEYRVHLK